MPISAPHRVPVPPAEPPGPLLPTIYAALLRHHGPQRWWPSRSGSPWETMLGAVLVQRTTWRNVELTLDALEATWGVRVLSDPRVVLDASTGELELALRPSGSYRTKSAKLRYLARFILCQGGPAAFARSEQPTEELRTRLLGVWGIGPETADSILLYALGRPVFVGDAYTVRLASRWGLLRPESSYDAARSLFMENLPGDALLLGEYHALIVAHGKEICRPQAHCEICPLNRSPRPAEHRTGLTEWNCPRLTGVQK